MKMTDDLYFDTDCLSSFIWAKRLDLLETLYAGRIIIPRPVFQELSRPCVPHMKKGVQTLISNHSAKICDFMLGSDEYELYNLLTSTKEGKQIGRGEASCIALAKVFDGVVASNNYKDITPYLKKYNLKNIDTGHILMEALNQNLITEEEGNQIWKTIKSRRQWLPKKDFTEYLKSQTK